MQTARRIHSIDVARGVAMVLMAIDHVRVYAGVPPGGPKPGVFFTRWITNFVAPAFASLAGTSAYLLGRRMGNRRALARYLVTRGGEPTAESQLSAIGIRIMSSRIFP
jgi:uncharacterized membrane protein